LDLPWVGTARIRLAIGLRYTYTGGKIGGVLANCDENVSEIALRESNLHVHALDALLRVTIVYF